MEQATVQNLKKDSNSPATLLSGSTEALEKRFKIIDQHSSGDESSFHLTPRVDQDMIKEVILNFKAKKLYQLSVIDNLGQKTNFNFSNVEINPKLPSALFRFKPPKGVDVVQQ